MNLLNRILKIEIPNIASQLKRIVQKIKGLLKLILTLLIVLSVSIFYRDIKNFLSEEYQGENHINS